MKYKRIQLQVVFVLLSVILGCTPSLEKNANVDFISSGGVPTGKRVCPSAPNDIIVKLPTFDPSAAPGEPEMTLDGIMDFMDKNHITTIPQLLNTFPDEFRTNFSFVEVTRGEGKSSLNFPRIVLFGPDGRFMMNVGTLPEDPKYDLLDCAELDDETGEWEFSQLDFTKKKPVIHRKPEECLRCHGRNQPRPVWGTSLDWPGVYGDNEAPGLTGDAFSPRHVRRMTEIRDGHGGSTRFKFLKWRENEKLQSGSFRRIADNAFGPELLVSNFIMGTATGRGAFLRIKTIYPKRYKALREELLLLAYEKHLGGVVSEEDLIRIEKVVGKYGVEGRDIDALLAALGLDTDESFSLGTLAEEEEPRTNWSLGDGDLYEQVFLQVLDDLSKSDPIVREILTTTPSEFPVFKCEDVVANLQDMVDYKMLYMYHLKGKARYEVNKVYYPLEAERVFDIVLKPILEPLTAHLRTKIDTI